MSNSDALYSAYIRGREHGINHVPSQVRTYINQDMAEEYVRGYNETFQPGVPKMDIEMTVKTPVIHDSRDDSPMPLQFTVSSMKDEVRLVIGGHHTIVFEGAALKKAFSVLGG